ncbi:MAG TPA: MarR family transcriptional regulator [Vicinamibacterales bacterium]|nr:MarR family transcriptional regulator [Vicinamibacterales bacterium]
MRHVPKPGPRPGAAPDDGGMPAFGDVLEFMRLIWGISHGLQATSKRMEAGQGITGPQRLVVRIVGRLPGLAAGKLANVLHLHPSTLTGVLRRLEDRGVITRRPGERDRRQARLYLTAAGAAIDRRHAGTVEAAVRRALAGLDSDSIEAATKVLRALETALGGKPGSGPRTPHPSTRGDR